MKKYITLLSSAIFLSTSFCNWASFLSDKLLSIDKTIDNLYAIGNQITLEWESQSDWFFLWNTVKTENEISKDLLWLWWNLIINWDVWEDSRIIAWSVTITSKQIWWELIIFWWNVEIDWTKISWDCLINAYSVKFRWSSKWNCQINAETVLFDAQIAGNTIINAKQISIWPSAKISWNLDYSTTAKNAELEKISKWTVNYSELNFNQKDIKLFSGKTKNELLNIFFTYKFIFLSFFWIIFTFLLNRPIASVNKYIITKPKNAILIWIWYLLFLPIFTIICLISVIGIPFSSISIWEIIFINLFYELFVVTSLSVFLIKKLIRRNWWSAYIFYVLIIICCAFLISLIVWLDFILATFVIWWTIWKTYEIIIYYRDRNKQLALPEKL